MEYDVWAGFKDMLGLTSCMLPALAGLFVLLVLCLWLELKLLKFLATSLVRWLKSTWED